MCALPEADSRVMASRIEEFKCAVEVVLKIDDETSDRISTAAFEHVNAEPVTDA